MSEEDFLIEMRNTFLDEFEDIIEQIECAFLKFEQNPEDKDLINEIFRYFHNMKGSSKSVNIGDLAQFAHEAENLLSLIRSGELDINDEMVDSLLESTDLMKTSLDHFREGDLDSPELVAYAKTFNRFYAGEEGAAAGAGEDEDGDSGFGFFGDDDDENESAKVEVAVAVAAPAESEVNVSAPTTADSTEPAQDNPQAQAPAQPAEQPAAKPAQAAKQPAATAAKPPQGASAAPAKAAAAKAIKEEMLKIPLKKIDYLLNLFGEQIILQATLDWAADSNHPDKEELTRKSMTSMRKITQDLQYTMVTLRMVPVSGLFQRMDRVIRDISKFTGKKINFVKAGEGVDLDRNIVDALIDPMTHMVRNAVDHGIEEASVRKELGKDTVGTVALTAKRLGGFIEIKLQDDGKGLDKDKIIKKALQLEIYTEAELEGMSDTKIYDLIFAGGFSTVDKATEISGRGVGMDVVRQQITSLKGSCSISTSKGEGTTFTLRLPMSMAMFNGTVIRIHNDRYVIPNSDFTEVISYQSNEHTTDSELVTIKDRLFNLIDLRERLVEEKDRPENWQKEMHDEGCIAIVVYHENKPYALLVSDILSQEQIVLKDLGPQGKQIKEATGGTILGNGRVALVLDVVKIIEAEDAKRTPESIAA